MKGKTKWLNRENRSEMKARNRKIERVSVNILGLKAKERYLYNTGEGIQFVLDIR